jgi:hypothetical protein
MEEAKQQLKKIFAITEQKDRVDAFADTFMSLVFEDAVYSLIQSLPKNRQSGASKKWDANRKNPAALFTLLKHYFTEKEINTALNQTANKAITSYLESVEQDLDEEERKKLFKLSKQLMLPEAQA